MATPGPENAMLSSLGRFPSFVVVGSLGFIIDATVLSLLVHVWDWHPYAARALSFPPAVTVTWFCNRRWVFSRTPDPAREYGAYFSVQAVGAGINFGVYALLLALVPTLERVPLVPLVAGSALALVFNYSAARRWVFGGPR
ncbi:MAG TPA: GtrA family protein [Gammaproteobacteria bacterium]|nr:GtrA family protein [Gammaproteobacteria bacterium]